MKKCKDCGCEKSLNDFYTSTKGKFGRSSYCKECELHRNKQYRLAWNQEKKTKYSRNSVLRKFNISSQRFEEILEEQEFRCAICKVSQEDLTRNFAVDHDHSCCPGDNSCGNCVRGLLCHRCNTGIALLGESQDVILDAAMYLMSYRNVLGVTS